MNSAAGLPEPARKPELLIKQIVDKHLTYNIFIIIFCGSKTSVIVHGCRDWTCSPWYTGVSGWVCLFFPGIWEVSANPQPATISPPGSASVLLPTGQLVGQFLSQLWESFEQEFCICPKAHFQSGSSVKADQSGDTPNSTSLSKLEKVRTESQGQCHSRCDTGVIKY